MTGFTEQRAFGYPPRSQPLRASTENGGATWLTHGPEAMDDCSVRTVELGAAVVRLVTSTDFIRGRGFELCERGFLNDRDLGHYLAGANLSDIAAMGAQPLDFHMIVRYPKGYTEENFTETMAGFMECADQYGCDVQLAGGDTGSYDAPVLAATVSGVSKNGLLMQANARPGHFVYATGPTGLAAAARIAAEDINHEEYTNPLIEKWRHVRPRVKEGLAVTQVVGDSGAGTDTSDGLMVALNNIARKSGVGMHIFEEDVPTHPSVEFACRKFGKDVLDVVFGNSVDFELVFTAPRELDGRIRDTFAAQDLEQPHRIGEVVDLSDFRGKRGTNVSFEDGCPLPGRIEMHAA